MDTSVIVVDDDFDSMEVLSEYLELKEISVVAKAKNGQEAAELYEQFKPELVLLDVMMPGYDGFYALKKIKEQDPNAKVIFVTAATNATTQKKLFETNVDGIIFKPFDMHKLMEVLHVVKNGRRCIPSSVRSLAKI